MKHHQLAGTALILAGLALTLFPDWVTSPPEDAELFHRIERRIPWGALLGAGFFAFSGRFRPRRVGVAWAALSLTAGILVARLVGLALDGSHPRQWMWVAVEAAVLFAVAAYIRTTTRR